MIFLKHYQSGIYKIEMWHPSQTVIFKITSKQLVIYNV